MQRTRAEGYSLEVVVGCLITSIVAPISGRTGIRQVDLGNIVHASDASWHVATFRGDALAPLLLGAQRIWRDVLWLAPVENYPTRESACISFCNSGAALSLYQSTRLSRYS